MWQICLFVYLLVKVAAANPISNEQNAKVCENEQCKIAAAFINSVMNKTVDPCDDFYNYACGSWSTNYPIPNNEKVWNLGKMIESNAIIETKEILEEDEGIDDITPLKYEKWYYKSCMDIDKIDDAGIRPLEEVLDYFGGWPITMNNSDWNDDSHDWQSIHEFYTMFKDLSSIFNIFVYSDDRNSSRNAIHLTKPAETLFDKLLKSGDETSVLQKYTEFIKDVVLVFIQSANKTISDDDILKDVEDIIIFEKSLRLLKVSANESEDLEPSRTYMTIEELQMYYDEETQMKSTSKINWLRVIESMFRNVENITIDTSEEIGIEDKYFFHNLLHLLDETPNRVIVNYIHWKFIASSLKYTNKEMRDLFTQVTTTEDTGTISERWEVCRADMRFGIGYRYEYVRRHFSEATRKMAFDIASEMRGEMLGEMEHSAWLDDVAKEESAIKLHALKWHMAGSHFFLRRELVEHIYEGLVVTSDYFENVQNAREFFMRRQLKRLRHTRHPQKYVRADPLLASSSYDSARNILVMTPAQLSVLLFHYSLPLSVNYGYIAPTMGQLMSRTLEKEVNTNMYMAPWSTYLGDTYKSYEPKTDCLTKQYYNYSVGPSTIDENMYDAIGLKVAYNAFRSSFIDETALKLPGLEDFSEDQLFFVSYAVEYCQTATSKYLAEHDPAFYTPSEYRVIGTLANSEYFARAFKCPVSSPMNPEHKCVL